MSDSILKFANKDIELPAPIKQRVELGKLIVIRVYPSDDVLNDYPQKKLNRNVYAYDVSGELVWQIQEAPHGGSGEDKAYMDIKIDGGKLVAGNWIGVDYLVNAASGVVSQAQKDIRPWQFDVPNNQLTPYGTTVSEAISAIGRIGENSRATAPQRIADQKLIDAEISAQGSGKRNNRGQFSHCNISALT